MFENLKISFNKYFIDVLKNQYHDFSGRSTRKQFWMYLLYLLVTYIVIALIAGLIKMPFLVMIVALGFVVPNIAMVVRRIRDLGISGWFVLIGLIPIINISLLVAYCLPTDFLKPYAEKLMKKK